MTPSSNVSLDALPLLCEGVDIKSLNITPEEGFLLSRIDGQLRVRHLVTMTGMPQEQALKLIQNLLDKKAIILHQPKPAPADKAEAKTASEATVRLVINLKAIPAGKDFEDFVDKLLNVLNRIDYYSLLGVERNAGLAEIKKAYRKMSKVFHPDRYFQKVSPEFRRKLQNVFKQVNIAYQVLTDDERRKSYAAQLQEKGVESAGEELKLEVTRKIYSGPKLKLGLTEDRAKAREEKLRRMFAGVKDSPLQEHLQKSERLYQLAMEEVRRKNFASAKINLKLAIQLDPTGGKKYQEELARIDQIEKSAAAELVFEEGRAAEENGEYQKASRCYADCLKQDPNNKKYIASQARVMIKYLNNFEKGRGLLLQLLETDAKNAEYYYLLGLAYKGLEQKRAAEVQFQKALELDAKHKEAQKELKALR